MSDFSTVRLGGLDFAALSEIAVVDRVRTALACGVGGRIATPNVDILRQVAVDDALRSDLGTADLVVADGTPLVWASRLAGAPLPERVTGSGLIWALSQGLAADRRSVYLLGGAPRSSRSGAGAPRAAGVLKGRYPGLRVAGWASPRFGFERNTRLLSEVLDGVLAAEPDLVFVGLGFPKQERLIGLLRPLLPATWFLGCGAAINFVAGDQVRAPDWMQRHGLEWMHRLLCEPGRLANRYLKHDAPYALRLLAAAAIGREGTTRVVSAPLPVRRVVVGRHAGVGTAPLRPGRVGRHRARPRPYRRVQPARLRQVSLAGP
jgi:N-acetylglucosaminyldiphosphoundecaprenol N-acetyl-beta-D-mannosaminyltransferase